MTHRAPGTLSPFAAALVDALLAAGWSYFPVERRLRDDGTGADLYLQSGSRALVRLPGGGTARPYSRQAAPVAAAHEVARKARAVAALAAAPEGHACRRPTACACSIQGLEPAEDCPVHGGGGWPPRCEVCGRFLHLPPAPEGGAP